MGADGEGSYERFIANGLAYVHRVLHRRNGSAAFLGMGFAHLAMSTYAQGAGNLMPRSPLAWRGPRLLGVRELALDCPNRHEARKVRDPRDLRSKYRLRTCEPRTGATAPIRTGYTVPNSRWPLQRGCPGLVQGAPRALGRPPRDQGPANPVRSEIPTTARIPFVPGAYDGELTALQHLLDNGLLSRARCEGQ